MLFSVMCVALPYNVGVKPSNVAKFALLQNIEATLVLVNNVIQKFTCISLS